MIRILRRLQNWFDGTRPVLMAGLWLTCAAAWVLVGGVHPGNQVILDSAALLLGTVALIYSLRHRRTTAIRFAFWVPGLLALFSAIQIIPGLGRFDSLTSTILSTVTQGLSHPPASTLSWDRPGTVLATLHAAALAALVLAGAVVARRRGETLRFAWGLDAILLVVAGAALVNWFTDPGRVWWVYRPLAKSISPLAPMVNENHAAGLYLMATMLHLGLSLNLPRGRKRNVSLALTLLPGFLLMLAQSRGGYAGGLAGLFVLAVILWRSGAISTGALWQGASAVALVVIGLLPSVSFLREAFGATGISGIPEDTKVALWGRGLDMAFHHSFAGVGRGAYQVAFTRYNDLTSGTVTHAENWFVQLSAETGFIVTGLLVILGLMGAWRYFRRCNLDAAGAGLSAALVGILVQNLGDFNLEFAGTAFPAALMAGLLAGQCLARDRRNARSSRHRSRRDESQGQPAAQRKMSSSSTKTSPDRPTGRRLIKLRQLSYAAAGLVLLLGFGCAILSWQWAAPHNLRADTKQAHFLLANARGNDAKTFLEQALTRHPADYHLQTLMAVALLEAGRGRPLAWVNHALLLKPNAAWPHLVAATVLERRDRQTQAAQEYRIALQRGLKMTSSLLEKIRRLSLTLAAIRMPEIAATRLASEGTAQAILGRPLPGLLLQQQTQRVTELTLVAALTSPLPKNADAWTRLGRSLIDKGHIQLGTALLVGTARTWPDRAGVLSSLASLARRRGDIKTALWWIEKLIAVKPSPKAYLGAIRLAERTEGTQKALDLAMEGLRSFPADLQLTAQAARLTLKQGRPAEAKKLIDELMSNRDVPLRNRPPLLRVLIQIAKTQGDTRTERRLVHRLERLKILVEPTRGRQQHSRP